MSIESESTPFPASTTTRQDQVELAVDEVSVLGDNGGGGVNAADSPSLSPSSFFLRRSERNPEIKYIERGDVKKLVQRIKR